MTTMGSLSFLFPLFLAGAAAVAVPIVLHLLRKEEAPELEFAAVRFIERAPIERSRRRRLRDLVLLLLRASAVALLAVAFARPYFAAATGPLFTSVTVVAVDVSFSMDGAERAATARRLALQAIDDAAQEQGVLVIAFDDTARLVAPLSLDRAVAREAIAALAPGRGGTSYGSALRLATEELGGRDADLTVVTDLQRGGWREGGGTLPDNVRLHVAVVPPAPDNLAVVAVQRSGTGLRAVVRNSGLSARAAVVTLEVDGRALGERSMAIEGERSVEVPFDQAVPATGVAVVRVRDEGGLPGDDERFFVLDGVDPIRALVVTSDTPGGRSGFYVERALSVAELPRPVRLDVVAGTRIQSVTDERLAGTDVVLVLGTRGIDRRTTDRLLAFVRDGGGLLLAGGPAADPASLALIVSDVGLGVTPVDESAPETTLVAADVRHPILRAFGANVGALGQSRFQRRVRFEVPETADVLARFGDGAAALVEIAVGGGRVLLLASDLSGEWNDFPRKASFVPFLAESVRHLARSRPGVRHTTIALVPPGVPPVPGVVERPDGTRLLVHVDTDEANLAVETEAEFRGHVTVETPATPPRAGIEARRLEEEQSVWRYGLLLVLLLVAGEAVLGRAWG
jgi:hypothetical protein